MRWLFCRTSELAMSVRPRTGAGLARMTYDHLSERCRRPSGLESGHLVGVVCPSLFMQMEHRARDLVASSYRHRLRDGIGRQQPHEPHQQEMMHRSPIRRRGGPRAEPHVENRMVSTTDATGKPCEGPAPGPQAAVPSTIWPKAASTDSIVASPDGAARKGRCAALYTARVREATSAPSRLSASEERRLLPPRPRIRPCTRTMGSRLLGRRMRTPVPTHDARGDAATELQ